MEVDTQAGVQAETLRMVKVNQAWPIYLTIWAVFGITGLLLRFAGTSDFYQGIGIALVFFAGVGLLIDGPIELLFIVISWLLGSIGWLPAFG